MSALCDEQTNFDEVTATTLELGELVASIAIGASIDVNTTIQQIALMRELGRKAIELKDLLLTVSSKGLVCLIIKSFDLDEAIAQVEAKVTEYSAIIDDFDQTISNLQSGSYEEVLDKVTTAFTPFDSARDQLLSVVKETSIQVLEPLTEIGVTNQEIADAVNGVETLDDVKTFLNEVFNSILDSALASLPE